MTEGTTHVVARRVPMLNHVALRTYRLGITFLATPYYSTRGSMIGLNMHTYEGFLHPHYSILSCMNLEGVPS